MHPACVPSPCVHFHMGHRGESATTIVKLIITHKVNFVICIYHKIIDCDVLSGVSIHQNCQKPRWKFGELFCAVDHVDRLAVKLSDPKSKNSDAILFLTHQVFSFNILKYEYKYTGLLLIINISQYSFPWCKDHEPPIKPESCRCQQHPSDYNYIIL